MKKLLLVAAATAALSTSVMAEDGAFYLRGDVGANFLTKEKIDGNKFKGKTATGLDLGVGYYVMENVRGELVYTHLFNPEASHSGDGYKVKSKANINALMVKGLVDVADLSAGKIFVGAGIGASQLEDKATLNDAGDITITKFKKKTNFCFTVGGGVGFEVADGVKADVQYGYTDFGKAKSVDGVSPLRRKTNAVKAGIRVEI